jgi:glycosyltransferase involved in cell wall biosynthesis
MAQDIKQTKRKVIDSSLLTIIIPAYNEEQVIQQTLEELRSTSELQAAKIVVVDDGSSDKTAEMASTVPGVNVLSHRYNIGYGGAIKTAVRAAKTKYVCWYDADGQHRPEDLIKLVRRVQKTDADWGLGVRSRDSHNSVVRKPGKFILSLAVQLAAGKTVPDFNSGLRVFRTQCLIRYLHLLPNGFSASTTTTLLMMERGYRDAHIKIQTRKRVGTSQVNQFKDGIRTLTLILRIFLLFRALLFFSTIGILMLLAGIIYSACITFINKMGIPIGGLFLMMTGILTIFMGLIADQLSLIRRERFEDINLSSYNKKDPIEEN